MLLVLPSDKLLTAMTCLTVRGFLQVFRQGQRGVGTPLPRCYEGLMQAIYLKK